MSNTGYKSIYRGFMRQRAGYVVSVWDGCQRRSLRRFFADQTWGAEALAEALRYRDAVERQLGKPRSERKVIRRERKPLRTVGPDGRPAFRVNYTAGHVQRSHYVYITQRGEAEAYRIACALLGAKATQYLRVPPKGREATARAKRRRGGDT